MGEVGGSRERRKSISETLGLSIPHQLMEAAPRKTDSALKGISSSSNNISDRLPINTDPAKEGLPSINYFCIFTTKLGQKEDDRHEQILYYGTRHNFNEQPLSEPCLEQLENLEDMAGDITIRPLEDAASNNSGSSERQHYVPLDTQVRQVGLAQAMINFSKIFSPEAPCENVHSKKARLVFFEPEQDFHFLLSIDLGVRTRLSETDKKSMVVDYLDRELSDTALQSVLRQAYTRFKIGHGRLLDILDCEGLKKLQKHLEAFFDGYMRTVFDIENIDIVSGMNGLPILPVTKATFLQVQSTFKALHLAFPTLETAGLIHQGRLVWSGTHLPIEVALFLTDLAKGSASLSEDPLLQLDGKKPRASFLSNLNPFFFSSGNNSQDTGSMGLLNFHPGFFTGWSPKSPHWGRCGRADTCEAPFKTFHLGSPPSPIQCGLFKCWRDGYLVLFFSDDSLSTPLLDKLDLHLHTHPLTDLEAHIKEDALLAREQMSNIDKKYCYAHFNGMNLALHSHLASLTPEVHSILLDLQTQTKKLRPNPQASVPLELLVRTTASPRKPTFWVGARVTPDSSLFFVIHRDATLAEIEGNVVFCFHVNFSLEDITKISNECFTNLFLG